MTTTLENPVKTKREKINTFLKVLENESQITRKMLSIVPDDKFDYQPHPKSMTIRRLATHIAELPTWLTMTLETSELDFAKNPYSVPELNSNKELMKYFEESLVDGRTHLAEGTDEQLNDLWTLRNGDEIYSTETKEEVLRMTFNQMVHHRAQLGVYLRLLNIPIPGSYGPSADEMGL
jgi:uncharacterized damage-inducible protein DinB